MNTAISLCGGSKAATTPQLTSLHVVPAASPRSQDREDEEERIKQQHYRADCSGSAR